MNLPKLFDFSSGANDRAAYALPIDLESRQRLKFLNGVLHALGLMVFALLAVGAMTPIRETVYSSGQIIPAGNVRSVEHFEGGIVSMIHARAGDSVTAGDLIVTFASESAQAELRQLSARKANLEMEIERLSAQLDQRPPDFSGWQESFPEIARKHLALYDRDMAALEADRTALRSRINQQRAMMDAARLSLEISSRQQEIMSERLQMRNQLEERGYGSRADVLQTRFELVDVQLRRADTERDLITAREQLTEAEANLASLQATKAVEQAEALQAATAELAGLVDSHGREVDRLSRLSVRAPSSGIVHELSAGAPGEVIEPGGLVAIIVPTGNLQAEINIKPDDIGHVRSGQDVEVSVSTYDAERDGVLPGRLVKISPNSTQNEKGEYFYKGTIELYAGETQRRELNRPLLPGMTVTATIVTGEKSFLRYILKPVFTGLETAFSER